MSNEHEVKALWIDVGSLQDYLTGERQIILYANTVEMRWVIAIVVAEVQDEHTV